MDECMDRKMDPYCFCKPFNETRNVSVWHRCPRPGPSRTTRRYFAKNVEKRAIILIIIGRFYPKSNLTIFYDYIPGYKIWIQYTNQSFLKKISEGKHLLKVKKGHNSHNNGLILPYLELNLYFMIIYLCVKFEFNTLMFSKDIKLKLFFNIEKGL